MKRRRRKLYAGIRKRNYNMDKVGMEKFHVRYLMKIRYFIQERGSNIGICLRKIIFIGCYELKAIIFVNMCFT